MVQPPSQAAVILYLMVYHSMCDSELCLPLLPSILQTETKIPCARSTRFYAQSLGILLLLMDKYEMFLGQNSQPLFPCWESCRTEAEGSGWQVTSG